MDSPLTRTLVELGDATSHNLEFSHQPGVLVSYGEETITEINLLEIRRRHPTRTVLQAFSKHQEARNGADWEWHIVGRRRTLKMRVQAKRVQRNDVLKIKHAIDSTGKQQRDVLVDHAQADALKPVYCIYCTEQQRSTWKQRGLPGFFRSYQTGCLLADADDVPLATKRLTEIEDTCIPWHFLFERSHVLRHGRLSGTVDDDDQATRRSGKMWIIPVASTDAEGLDRRWNPPTFRELNDELGGPFDQTGVHATTDQDRARLQPDTPDAQEVRHADRERLLERRIARMLVVDVRDG